MVEGGGVDCWRGWSGGSREGRGNGDRFGGFERRVERKRVWECRCLFKGCKCWLGGVDSLNGGLGGWDRVCGESETYRGLGPRIGGLGQVEEGLGVWIAVQGMQAVVRR